MFSTYKAIQRVCPRLFIESRIFGRGLASKEQPLPENGPIESGAAMSTTALGSPSSIPCNTETLSHRIAKNACKLLDLTLPSNGRIALMPRNWKALLDKLTNNDWESSDKKRIFKEMGFPLVPLVSLIPSLRPVLLMLSSSDEHIRTLSSRRQRKKSISERIQKNITFCRHHLDRGVSFREIEAFVKREWPEDTIVYTDASSTGWGIVFDEPIKIFQSGKWSTGNVDIGWAEAHTVRKAIEDIAKLPDVSGRRFEIRCDNVAVVDAWNVGRSKKSLIVDELAEAAQIALEMNVTVALTLIEGRRNKADRLSRGMGMKKPQLDTKISPERP